MLSDRERFPALLLPNSAIKKSPIKCFVSPRTVDGYREALFEKLEIKSRVGLVIYAIKNGIVNLNNKGPDFFLSRRQSSWHLRCVTPLIARNFAGPDELFVFYYEVAVNIFYIPDSLLKIIFSPGRYFDICIIGHSNKTTLALVITFYKSRD